MEPPPTVTVTETGCWLMAEAPVGDYHRVGAGRTKVLAHVLMYRCLVGPVGQGRQLHHTCVNPPCCNPAHIESLTPEEHRARHHAARTACRRGHAIADHGYRDANGVMRCNVCRRMHQAASKQRVKLRRPYVCPCGWQGVGADLTEGRCPSCGQRSGRWGPKRAVT